MDSTSQPITAEGKITGLLQKYPIVLQLLRFAAIGLLNTALSFVLANLISKYFGVEQGNKLALSSGVGFLFATLQSYYWNKDWAFAEQAVSLLKNFLRLVWVGLTGFFTLLFVLLGSKAGAPYYYYLIILIVFLLIQYALWKSFKLSSTVSSVQKNPFAAFFIVSLIGFAINYTIVSYFSSLVHLTTNPDLNKNIAFVAATCISLIWNFIGYKVIVFKK